MRTGAATGDVTGAPVAPVKLVIWDLDDTFWDGTLSEAAVTIDPARVELVHTLNARGIINSICSKNDAATVQSRLEAVELWSAFVFASVDWSPKGPRVARIVDDAQLRPENVLFVDDSPLNRGEVRHFCPGIQTAGPEILEQLLGFDALAGKDDRGLARLQQYRLLERKLSDRRSSDAGNEAFLRSCDIRIAIHHDVGTEADRLFELANRTHQLNFTKRRMTRADFDALLVDPDHECASVRVRDRYGDYGVCGFYTRSRSTGALDDYLFSCRVLNMGIEQWLYAELGRPQIVIAGEVASTLEGDVDWVTRDDAPIEAAPPVTRSRSRTRVLLVGGCDLDATASFLGGKVTTDTSHVGPTGAFVWTGHTEALRQSAAGLTDAQRTVVDRVPFVDQGVFASPAVVAPEYDVLIYSVLADYTLGLYRHRASGIVLPCHQVHLDLTDPAVWPRVRSSGADSAFLEWFAAEFESLGGIGPERFAENLRWLAGVVPARAHIVVLNGAEVPIENPHEPARHLRHRELNAVLDAVVATLPTWDVCDVRTFVESEADLTNNIRHYQRRAYLRMADTIRAIEATNLGARRAGGVRRSLVELRKFAGRRHAEVRSAVLALRSRS